MAMDGSNPSPTISSNSRCARSADGEEGCVRNSQLTYDYTQTAQSPGQLDCQIRMIHMMPVQALQPSNSRLTCSMVLAKAKEEGAVNMFRGAHTPPTHFRHQCLHLLPAPPRTVRLRHASKDTASITHTPLQGVCRQEVLPVKSTKDAHHGITRQGSTSMHDLATPHLPAAPQPHPPALSLSSPGLAAHSSGEPTGAAPPPPAA